LALSNSLSCRCTQTGTTFNQCRKDNRLQTTKTTNHNNHQRCRTRYSSIGTQKELGLLISGSKTLATKLPKYSEQLRKEQNGSSLVAAKLREGCRKNVAYVSDVDKSLLLRARFPSSLFSHALSLSLSLSLISSLSLPSKEMFGKWSKFVLPCDRNRWQQVLRNLSHFTIPH
jgi:hypothetical protein